MARRRLSFVKVGLALAVVALVPFLFLAGQDDEARGDLGSGSMFDRIAGRYDSTNRFMSLGLDSSWRRAMVAALNVKESDRVLDLATGTADVALLEGAVSATVLGIDPSAKMLEIGRRKVERKGISHRVVLEKGDATNLGLDNATFDKISMAFGIRNVPNYQKVLAEMRRVVRPGGTLAILEFCEPQDGPLAPVARFFVTYLVPRIGALLSGDFWKHWPEYEHLQKSIANFPPPDRFADLIRKAGFALPRPVTFFAAGSVALYVAVAVDNWHPLPSPSS